MTMCGEQDSALAGLMTQEQRDLMDSLCEGTEVPVGEAEVYARALRTARRHIAALEARLEQVGTAVQLGAEHDAVTREAAREQAQDLSRELDAALANVEALQSKVAELEAALELALAVPRPAPASRPAHGDLDGCDGEKAARAHLAPTPDVSDPAHAPEPPRAPRPRRPEPTPEGPALAPPSEEGQDVDWRAVRLALNTAAKHGDVTEASAALRRLHQQHSACIPGDHAFRVLAWTVKEAAQLGAEHWKGRAQALWKAGWNARAHLHNGRAGDALSALSAALEAATAGATPEAGGRPSFAGSPRMLRHQTNGRHALHIVLNGVRLVLLGDFENKESRHLLCYLFACPEWRLSVVRESELMSEMGRPAVVERGEGPSRG